MEDRNYLKIDGICKEYKRGKVKANRNISTSLYPGQITAIIGHNGAGKTTLLNQIIGVVKPDSGEISFRGYSLVKDTKSARNFVSIMPQFHAPLTGVTLRQCIEAILYIRGIRGKQIEERIKQIVKALDIEQWLEQSGDKLSGGIHRLASFAMAVVCPTPIVLLDEPTNDVDPVRRKLVWQYMKKLAGRGHIVLVVTHNLLEVEQYADRYLLFDHGKLIQDAPTRDIHQKLKTNTLIVVTDDNRILEEAPASMKRQELKEEAAVVLTLSSEQVPHAIDWVIKMVNAGKIHNYKLTTASLDVSYGGMTNEG